MFVKPGGCCGSDTESKPTRLRAVTVGERPLDDLVLGRKHVVRLGAQSRDGGERQRELEDWACNNIMVPRRKPRREV